MAFLRLEPASRLLMGRGTWQRWHGHGEIHVLVRRVAGLSGRVEEISSLVACCVLGDWYETGTQSGWCAVPTLPSQHQQEAPRRPFCNTCRGSLFLKPSEWPQILPHSQET